MKEEASRILTLTGTHGVSPASDSAHGAISSTAIGQGHSLNILIESSGLAKLDQHDVTVNGPGVIAGVADDLPRGDELLRSLRNYDVVLAQTNLHTSERRSQILFRTEETNELIHKLFYEDHVRLVAVSSRHNPVLADQRATAEVVARVQRHLPGLGVGCALISTNNLVIIQSNYTNESVSSVY